MDSSSAPNEASSVMSITSKSDTPDPQEKELRKMRKLVKDAIDPDKPDNTKALQDPMFFMNIAIAAALRSEEPVYQVGCVIVGPQKEILAVGYNRQIKLALDGVVAQTRTVKEENKSDSQHDPQVANDANNQEKSQAVRGDIAPKKPDRSEDDKLRREARLATVVHAEAEALARLSWLECKDATVYVTRLPCHECAKLLFQKKIKKVVYLSYAASSAVVVQGKVETVGNKKLEVDHEKNLDTYDVSQFILAAGGIECEPLYAENLGYAPDQQRRLHDLVLPSLHRQLSWLATVRCREHEKNGGQFQAWATMSKEPGKPKMMKTTMKKSDGSRLEIKMGKRQRESPDEHGVDESSDSESD